jgi:hypothetical protein
VLEELGELLAMSHPGEGLTSTPVELRRHLVESALADRFEALSGSGARPEASEVPMSSRRSARGTGRRASGRSSRARPHGLIVGVVASKPARDLLGRVMAQGLAHEPAQRGAALEAHWLRSAPRCQASSSAQCRGSGRRPRQRRILREIVVWERPRKRPIWRAESPPAIPREISSRGVSQRAPRRRRRRGGMPPQAAR